jgi:hypothetical protein
MPVRRTRRCPRCREPLLPIVYGHPTPEAEEASWRREIVLGGCMVLDGQPEFACPGCGREWRSRGQMLVNATPAGDSSSGSASAVRRS